MAVVNENGYVLRKRRRPQSVGKPERVTAWIARDKGSCGEIYIGKLYVSKRWIGMRVYLKVEAVPTDEEEVKEE